MCSAICGGAQAILEVEPEITEANMDEPYRVRIPYPFEWRVKLGRVECDCQTVVKWYRPWHGIGWLHERDCAIFRHVKRYPGILNSVEVSDFIAHTN
jgi:hypothetical protein